MNHMNGDRETDRTIWVAYLFGISWKGQASQGRGHWNQDLNKTKKAAMWRSGAVQGKEKQNKPYLWWPIRGACLQGFQRTQDARTEDRRGACWPQALFSK